MMETFSFIAIIGFMIGFLIVIVLIGAVSLIFEIKVVLIKSYRRYK